MRRQLLGALGVVLASLLPFSTGAGAENEASRTIRVLVVPPPDVNAQKGVIAWMQAFKNNLRFLLSDATARNAPSLKVTVSVENVDDIISGMLENSFGLEPSLQALSTVARHSGRTTIIDNDIYLGDLKGSLDTPFVYISREIEPSQYAITREALSVVTLYAYGMALSKSSPDGNRFAVCRILDRANMYKSKDMGKEVQSYLAGLFQAISSELDTRACGGKR